MLERAQILAEDNLITLDDLPDALQALSRTSEGDDAGPFNLREVERRTVRAALQQAQGNKVQAAKALGVSRRCALPAPRTARPGRGPPRRAEWK